MTIAQAFKEKKKLLAKLNNLASKIQRSNSKLAEQSFDYEIRNLIEEYEDIQEKLIVLKHKIIKANMPIYDKIFRMAELKGKLSMYSRLDTTSGKVNTRFSDELQEYTSVIDVLEKDSIIEGIQSEIEDIQDILDDYNHKTNI